MSDDTIAYTDDDIAELRRRLNDGYTGSDAAQAVGDVLAHDLGLGGALASSDRAATLHHQCTPKWWPHKMGETWTCECGHRFVTDVAANFTDPTSAKAIRLGLLDPLRLGWRTA